MAPNDESSFNVPLRPLAKRDTDEESIINLQYRLRAQRGEFRHITEEGLEREIQAAENGDEYEGATTKSEDVEGEPDEKQSVEQLVARKQELMQILQFANNEAMLTLDVVSLLLSKDSARTATISMSPGLKAIAPVGSLGHSRWEMPPIDEATHRQRTLVAKGARMQGLNRAADALLESAERLNAEVRKETRYWQDALSITQKGWLLRRVPQQASMLGVQLVSTEANDIFRRRGFAPLQSAEDGRLVLDEQFVQLPKQIRVRIFESGRLIAISKKGNLLEESDASIEGLLRRARDSLYEEELFYEMALESRILLPYKVRLEDSCLIIPIPAPSSKSSQISKTLSQQEIRVDLIDSTDFPTDTQTLPEDATAQNVALALRLLLAHAHRQRLLRRSETPRPLSGQKRPQLTEPIIRPLLGFFHHSANLSILREHLEKRSSVMCMAGVTAALSFKTDISLSEIINGKAADSKPVVYSFLSALMQPLATAITLSLPSSTGQSSANMNLSISVRSHISPPTFGTDFKLTKSPPINASQTDADKITNFGTTQKSASKPYSFSTVSALAAQIDRLLELELARAIISTEFPSWSAAYRSPVLTRNLKPPQPLKTDQLVIEFQKSSLSLRYRAAKKQAKERTWTWDAAKPDAGTPPLRQLLSSEI